jgi:hypothetical protein
MRNSKCDVTERGLTSLFDYCIIDSVRTTINIDDDVFKLVSRYAESRSLTLGRAVSELVRRGFDAKRPLRQVHGIHVFELPPESPKITSKQIKELEDEV